MTIYTKEELKEYFMRVLEEYKTLSLEEFEEQGGNALFFLYFFINQS